MIFQIFLKFGQNLAAKQIMVVILRPFRVFLYPWQSWERLRGWISKDSNIHAVSDYKKRSYKTRR